MWHIAHFLSVQVSSLSFYSIHLFSNSFTALPVCVLHRNTEKNCNFALQIIPTRQFELMSCTFQVMYFMTSGE